MTASPGDGEHAAREGYYPDPSIPGYVRYWNGAAWVPGTSRPAPDPAPVEETGPVFLDETSATEALPDPGPGAGSRAAVRDHAAATAWRGEPEREREREREREGGGWQADPAHQAGFGGPRDVRVSWGGPEPEDARPGGISLARPAAAPAAPAARRLPAQAAAESVGILSARPPAWPDAPATGVSGLTSTWPEATAPAPAPAAGPEGEPGRGWAGTPGTGGSARAAGFPGEDCPEPARWAAGAPSAPAAAASAPVAGDAARAAGGPASASLPASAAAWAGTGAPASVGGVRGAGVPAGDSRAASASASAPVWDGAPGAGVPVGGPARAGSRYPGPEGEPAQAWAGAAGQAPADAVRAAGAGTGAAGPVRAWAGGAGEPGERRSPAPAHPDPEEGVAHGRRRADAAANARPGAYPGPAPAGRAEAPAAHAPSSAPAPAPVAGEDARAVFERMAERAVRPAGLVRRGLARLLDSLVLAGVAVAVAAPLVPGVTAHVQAKVDAARASGRTTTVWLLDATTAGRLGLVLGALLLFGLLYEVLPTARWGRTPGKKLCGVRVLGTATLRPPGFGKALLRWLVYALLGLPGSLWCLVDRPRRRAWHDKAARTFVTR
ncbi:RDD family protein [Streptomyces sp. NPDC001594]|uniref:RDD family protein n=1 Tax=Streptomyces sp. NPDC001594 TaxID=3364590 RepID=UPI0036BAA67E